MWVVIAVEISEDASVVLNFVWPDSGGQTGRIKFVRVRLVVLLGLGIVEDHSVGSLGSADSNAVEGVGLEGRSLHRPVPSVVEVTHGEEGKPQTRVGW